MSNIPDDPARVAGFGELWSDRTGIVPASSSFDSVEEAFDTALHSARMLRKYHDQLSEALEYLARYRRDER